MRYFLAIAAGVARLAAAAVDDNSINLELAEDVVPGVRPYPKSYYLTANFCLGSSRTSSS
jgi:hypothetical protein